MAVLAHSRSASAKPCALALSSHLPHIRLVAFVLPVAEAVSSSGRLPQKAEPAWGPCVGMGMW